MCIQVAKARRLKPSGAARLGSSALASPKGGQKASSRDLLPEVEAAFLATRSKSSPIWRLLIQIGDLQVLNL